MEELCEEQIVPRPSPTTQATLSTAKAGPGEVRAGMEGVGEEVKLEIEFETEILYNGPD